MKNEIYNEAGKAGLIMGLVSVVVTTTAYAIDYSIMATMSFGIGVIGLSMAMIIYFYIDWRKGRDGFVTFGEAYLFGFLTLIMSGVIGLIYTSILYGVIDPELPEKLVDAVIDNTVKMLESLGMSDSDIDKAIDNLEARPDQYSVMAQVRNFPLAIIFYAVFSLIMAAIFKKDRPPFGPFSEEEESIGK